MVSKEEWLAFRENERQQQQQSEIIPQEMSPLESFSKGFMYSSTQIPRGVEQLLGMSSADQSYEKLKKELEQAYSQHGLSTGAGEIAGGLAPALVTALLTKNPTATLSASGVPSALSRLAPTALGSAAEGYLSYVEPGQTRGANTATAAAFGTASQGLMEGIAKAAGALYNKAEPYAQRYLTKKMGDFIGEGTPEIGGVAQKHFDYQKGLEGKLWSDTKAAAIEADKLAAEINYQANPVGAQNWSKLVQKEAENIFDVSDYHNALNKKINAYELDSVKNPSRKDQNDEAIKILSELKSNKVSNWEDVVQQRQVINDKYRMEMTPEKDEAFKAVNYAAAAFNESAKKQAERAGLSEFVDVWDKANKKTQYINQAFFETVTPGQEIKRSTFKNYQNLKNPYGNDVAFVKQYVPKDSKDGYKKLDQFYEMIGDNIAAQDLMRNEVFAASKIGENINLSSFFRKYNRMSDEQLNRLFDKETKQKLDEGWKSWQKNPNAFREGASPSASLPYLNLLNPLLKEVGAPLAQGGRKVYEKVQSTPYLDTISQMLSQYAAQSGVGEERYYSNRNIREE